MLRCLLIFAAAFIGFNQLFPTDLILVFAQCIPEYFLSPKTRFLSFLLCWRTFITIPANRNFPKLFASLPCCDHVIVGKMVCKKTSDGQWETSNYFDIQQRPVFLSNHWIIV